MPKYSLIFLNYDPLGKNTGIINQSRKSILDRTVGYDYEFIEVRDVDGYVNAVNSGLQRATGEYMVILNDDILIKDGEWLNTLSVPNAITSWRNNRFYMTGDELIDGACWCIPRNVYEKVGLMDTAFGEGYGCDEIDYFYRAKEAGFKLMVTPFNLEHWENTTYKSYHKDTKEQMTERNVGIFFVKWKDKLNILHA